ncbi:MAG: peptidylprolyl isomerase [Ruminococcaceae bacterium]|nr:peptidylprolyl isomerase [Oscillospiraceae bacterium]
MFNQLDAPQSGETTLTVQTDFGDMKFRLFPDKAPKACENFITHAKNGYYDNLIFHRVINDFMIQGGDPTGTGMGGESIWGKAFEDEFDIDLRNYRGALSMANSGPDTNGSQFFVVQADRVPAMMLAQMEGLSEQGYPYAVQENYKRVGGTPWLDFKHTVFGQLYDGFDVLDAIAAAKVDAQDKPVEEIKILKIELG